MRTANDWMLNKSNNLKRVYPFIFQKISEMLIDNSTLLCGSINIHYEKCLSMIIDNNDNNRYKITNINDLFIIIELGLLPYGWVVKLSNSNNIKITPKI